MNVFVIYNLPSWLLMQLARPFLPRKHQLKKHISLLDWSDNGTSMLYVYDFIFWLCLWVLLSCFKLK